LPMGSVQLEEVSSELYVGTIEKPLPAKASNKVVSEVSSNLGKIRYRWLDTDDWAVTK